MTTSLTCRIVEDRELVERYTARVLPESDAIAFEEHYLTCRRCQESVRLAAGLGRAFAAPIVPRSRAIRRRWFWVGVPVGLAAAAAGILILGPNGDPALRDLGRVPQAPVYLGVAVRAGPPLSADSAFALAMEAYSSGRFAEATHRLRDAIAAGVDSAPAEFFLGASLLMDGKAAPAAEAFARVIALGDTPYLLEARYYRSKSLLRLGRGRDALEESELARSPDTIIGRAARALSDSIREALRR
ncbi:MAG TPA: hypothetical protein VI383_01290 [Gemmatimonadales bacterium]|nr:hypothetical protein [Gemmatimonadales bacterium]